MALGSSERFDSRVADYVRWRPGYPDAALALVTAELGLGPGVTVADIGAGTGILTRPLLETGADVIAIDPNANMRAAAATMLGDAPNLRIREGTAEQTGLPDQSLDAIAVGQAFHWFSHVRAREEARRILRPGGKVVLLWNSKQWEASPLLAGYRALLDELAPEFAVIRHETTGEAEIDEFYGTPPALHTFEHAQRFDWDGLYGRVMSASYAPQPGAAGHEALVAGLRRLFAANVEANGTVAWPYSTMVYVGTLS